MSNRVDQERTFFWGDFVDDPVVPYPELVETTEVPFQGLGPDGFKVLSEPLEASDNPGPHGRILLLKIPDRRIQDA
jgi:hypothetical protein